MNQGELIRKSRIERGLTQKELAEKLNVSESYISQYERNMRNPKFDTLHRIADALNISVDDLRADNGVNPFELADAARKKDYNRFEQLLGYPKGTIFDNTPLSLKDMFFSDWPFSGNDVRVNINRLRHEDFFGNNIEEANEAFEEISRKNAPLPEKLRKLKYLLYYSAISSGEAEDLYLYATMFSENEIEAAIGSEMKMELDLEKKFREVCYRLSLRGKQEAIKRLEELAQLPQYQCSNNTLEATANSSPIKSNISSSAVTSASAPVPPTAPDRSDT